MSGKGPGVTLGIERMTWVSEMRPGFWQCAILQCDTTRIGQDAPYGAMPKLIHPSIPGPWHAPSLAFSKTWQVLGSQGGAWPGKCTWPNKEGSKRPGSSRVESSRVWLTDSWLGCQSVHHAVSHCQCQSQVSVSQSMTFSSATDALKCARNSAETTQKLRNDAARQHRRGLGWQPAQNTQARGNVIGSSSLSIWAVGYNQPGRMGDTPMLHVSAPRHAQHGRSLLTWTMFHNKTQVHTERQVVALRAALISRPF